MTDETEAYKQKIFSRLKIYYKDDKRVDEWYNRPHQLLGQQPYRNEVLSPRELVADGRGAEVLRFVRICLD